jgi:hypothetical protein
VSPPVQAGGALGSRLLDRVLDAEGTEISTWTAAQRARGVGWGTRFPESWRTYGTPPVATDA